MLQFSVSREHQVKMETQEIRELQANRVLMDVMVQEVTPVE